MSIKRNTIINLIGAIVPMAVMLITVPLYLAQLGEARYGVLALVWLILGYFSFLEMGLGKATANQIAKASDAPDAERAEIFWTALLINAAMGAVAAGILWLLGDYLITSILKMPDEFRREALAALPWLIATLPVALTSAVLNGALEGRSCFFTVNVLQVCGSTIFQIAPLIAATYYHPSLEIVIPVAILSRLLMYLPFLFYCYKSVPLSIIPKFSFARGKSLFKYGGWVSVSGVATPIVETFDRFMLGAIVGAQAVSHYTIAYQLATKIRIIPASLTRALFPRLSSDSSNPSELAERSVRKFLPIMTVVIISAIYFTQPFLDFWLKNEAALNIAPICIIFLVGVWSNSLAYMPYTLLHASGKTKLVAVIHLAELLPFISILYLLTLNFGVLGAVTAWTLRATFDAIFLYIAARNIKNTFIHLLFPFLIVLFLALSMIEYVDGVLSFWLKVASIFGLMTWLAVNAAITSPDVIKKIKNFGQENLKFIKTNGRHR